MTWEEIILKIRSDHQFDQLVKDAYLGSNLADNVERFAAGEEFAQTLALMQQQGIDKGALILDIGAGNGIATLAFALRGYKVIALEPDPSLTVGGGAIRSLVNHYKLSNVELLDTTAENMTNLHENVDMVYIRQAVHHADELKTFVSRAVQALRKGGLYLAVRDHVIYDDKDKDWFLASHPLHKFYGGENAFTLQEYLGAMREAGLDRIQHWSYYDSPLNYLPLTTAQLEERKQKRQELIAHSLRSKLGPLSGLSWIRAMYEKRVEKKLGPVLDEKQIPGRPYSFMGVKS